MSATRLALLFTTGLAALCAATGCSTSTTTGTAALGGKAVPAKRAATPFRAVVPVAAAPTSKAPALTTTGTAWPKVVGSLITYGQWLLANPNPNLAGTITVPGCTADAALTAELRSYLDQNAYVQPAAPILTTVTGPVGALGGQVTVDIQAVRGPEPVLYRTVRGGTTHIVSGRPALPPTALQLSLIRGADAHWRLCTVTDALTPDTDAVGALL